MERRLEPNQPNAIRHDGIGGMEGATGRGRRRESEQLKRLVGVKGVEGGGRRWGPMGSMWRRMRAATETRGVDGWGETEALRG